MRTQNEAPAPMKVFLIALVLGMVPSLFAATPEWVRQAAAQSLPTYDPETKAVVLLDEVAITVSGPNEYLEHHRRVVKILRPEGREEGRISVYLSEHEKVHSIRCWSIDHAGKEFELKDKDFVERGMFGFELYTDLRARTGTCPAAEAGSIIAFEYEVQRHDWVSEFEWRFQEDIPVRLSHVVLTVPPGWEFKTLWGSKTSVEPTKGSGNSWEWTLHDLAAIEEESMSPPEWSLCLRMELVFFPPQQSIVRAAGSWESLGRWYAQLTADRRTPTPELSERARQLTAGKTDFDGKARALASFLQSDVRYVAIEIGIGGFQPHRAGDIFRVRYGDCKDKATLMSAMLHEVGIESEYVLIDTERGIVTPVLPSIHFNHAILAIELPQSINKDSYRSVVTAKSGKQYLIFDPTDPYTPFGDLRGNLQDTYALLVANGSGELIHTPLFQPSANVLARTGHFTLSAEGALSGEIVESMSGDHASRTRGFLLNASQQERSQQLERMLGRSLKGFTLEKTNIEQLDQLQQNLAITLDLNNPGYGQIRGPLMLVRPRIVGEKSFSLGLKPRHSPFQFADTSRETDVYEVELPKNYVVDDVPNPVNVDMGFATYQSKVEVTGTMLRYSREFVRRDVLIQPERTEDLRKLQGIIGADENSAVVLKRAQ